MSTNSITTREFLATVIDANISDAVTSKAQSLLESLDKRNEKRKSSDSKEKREVIERRSTVLAFLDTTPRLTEDIAESIGLSVGQTRSALSFLVSNGHADKVEVKVGKSKRMAYTLHIGE